MQNSFNRSHASEGVCLNFNEFTQTFGRLLSNTSFNNRDNVARMIIFVDKYYETYNDYQWLIAITVKSASFFMPGGPLVPVVANLTLEILMHPNTERLWKRSLYDLWLDIQPSGDEEYYVYRVDDDVVIIDGQVEKDYPTISEGNRTKRELHSFQLSRLMNFLDEIIDEKNEHNKLT